MIQIATNDAIGMGLLIVIAGIIFGALLGASTRNRTVLLERER